MGDIQRLHLERQHRGDSRPTDVLHPSELCKEEWCQRAGYFQLLGLIPDKDKNLSWRRQMIFDEGHTIHDKWQTWLWDLGVLQGQFFCLHCQFSWKTKAPQFCEKCEAPRVFLKYFEVPLHSMHLRIGGHADGLVDRAIVEIKSVGLGTLPFENPDLLAEHTYRLPFNGKKREFIDLDALWDGIRHPFPSHLRQGDLYVFLLGDPSVEEVIFLYECKWNQRSKEFVTKYSSARIRTIISSAEKIAEGFETNTPPPCSHDEDDGCPQCEAYEGAWIARERYHQKFPGNVRRAGQNRPVRKLRK